MGKKWFLDFIIVTIVFILHTSFVTAFHVGLEFLLPLVLLCLYYVMLVSLKRSIFVSIYSGLLLGAQSSASDGSEIVAMLCMVWIISFLFSKVFTNRSILSFSVLVGLGVGIYDGILYCIDWFYGLILTDHLQIFSMPIIQVIMTHMIINTIFMLIIFSILRLVDIRFKTFRLHTHG